MTLANQTEKNRRTVIIEGAQFDKVLAAKRLRVEVVTVLNTLVDEDINLNGLAEAYGVITGPTCKP